MSGLWSGGWGNGWLRTAGGGPLVGLRSGKADLRFQILRSRDLAAFSIGGAKFGSFVRARNLRVAGNIDFLMMRLGQNWGSFGRAVFSAPAVGRRAAPPRTPRPGRRR